MEKERNEPFIDAERLQEIREQTDWKKLFNGLGLEKNVERSNECDWWTYSPFAQGNRPSFHLNNRGLWYDFLTKEGGGVIELVQKFYGVDCYEAGQMILENNWLYSECIQAKENLDPPSLHVNPPIRQDLRPQLRKEKHNPVFEVLGISKQTCDELGCGYLSESRGILNDSLVFQIRGVQEGEKGLEPTILSHIGFSDHQEKKTGWIYYDQFHPETALYNMDNLLLNQQAIKQTRATGKVLLLNDPFDVAKCWESGIYNVISPVGKPLSTSHKPLFELIQTHLNPECILMWNHRKKEETVQKQIALQLEASNFLTKSFDWEQTFKSPKANKDIPIPSNITSPKAMSIKQIQWLHRQGII